ncbi:helix-turn-helix domain-containing protein [Methylobacterium sp. J-030]|uniref:helix-turn-helix domain-containing protein n=1 Tax=Methylobacterium sp. J-030 TaxID=2836627 RepID=UPI001FB949BD|nr:helix-turn-helix transcriptional regulator [Methylobacterium sp. J-030]MCJ2068296.1 helix-turn-helix domain-containing protein [Methylobacterium sp. J-030]
MLKLATKSERLRWARINAGFPSAAQAARRLGVPYGTYAGHENGLRGVKESELERYAKAFGVTVIWLIYGDEQEDLENQLVPYFGLAGFHPEGRLDGVVEAMNTNWLTYPRISDRPLAYIVVAGNLARGIADREWHITIERNFTPPDEDHIGCLCVCKIKGGNYFLRTLQRGRKNGRFDLEGPTFETRRDEQVEKVSFVSTILTTAAVRELNKLNKDRVTTLMQGIEFDVEPGS